MPPARAARSAAAPSARDDGADAGGDPADRPPLLVARLEAAEETGEVDARQLADLLGVTAGGLRTALGAPALLTSDQAAAVGRLLGVDAATMRALRRPAAPADPQADAAAPDEPRDGPRAARVSATAAPPPDAAPLSTLALLDGVLRAVRGDAVGRALRAAVLDVAVDAARAVGRPLPPGAHALRARLATPEVGDHGAGTSLHAEPPDGAAVATDDLTARAAALVGDLQRTTPGYDDLFAPLHDDALADLIARHALAVHPAPGVPAGTRFVLTPPLLGRRRLVFAASATPDQRRLVVRAALAASAAGHAGDDQPLASPAPDGLARVADVVALADLVPFWQVADLRRRGRLGWRALAEHVAALAAAMAGDWDAARSADRGALRVALFRTHQL